MILPDEIIRSNRKTLSITVDARGRLIVRAPRRFAVERIYAFLQEKEGWIVKQRKKRENREYELSPTSWSGYVFPLLGRPTTVYLVEGKRVGYDPQADRVYLPSDKPEERLKKWLKENAKRIFATVTERQATRMGVTYGNVGVTSAKTRWGSCSGRNDIRYSFRLLFAPREVIEYVAVHELAHVRHRNHSSAFWKEVEKYLPDWKEKRGWLKTHAYLMEIL